MPDDGPIIIDARVGNVRLEIAIRVVDGQQVRVRPSFNDRAAGVDDARELPPRREQAAAAPRREGPPPEPRRQGPPPDRSGNRPSIIPELNRLRKAHGLDNAAGAKAIASVTGAGSTLKDIEECIARTGHTLAEICAEAEKRVDKRGNR